MALLLNKGLKGSGFFRTVGFMPVVISSVMVSLIWGMIYNTEYGMLNSMLAFFGLESWQQNWLGDMKWSMLSISVAYIWQNCGLYMVIFLAALQNIPDEVNEAAELDGATGFRRTLHITIPMLRSTIMVAVVYSISNSFRVFDLIQVLTGGGPAHQTEVMTLYMYNSAFMNLRYGYGSAASILILLFSLIVISIVNRIGRETDA
ncbi:Lactose transport system permease protein LacF [compost metagenome]